jgi:PAS domain S-box-containing protein
MRKRDGTYIPVEVSGRRVADNLIQRLYRDITERRLTEEMRKEALAQGEMLEKIFSLTHICVVVMDTQFNFIRVNQSYANACGYPPEFFPSKNVFQLYPHAENERIFRKVVETGEPFTMYASPLEFPDFPDRGVTYWDWTLQPVKDSRGGVEGLILVLLDVTERERANAVVRESERKFRLVTETIEDVFWIGNPGLRHVEYISPAFEKIWGRSMESLYASPRTFLEAVHPEDLENLKKTIEEAQTAGRNYTLEYRIIGNGGSVRWIEERGFPIRDDAGNLVLICGVCKDISDRKRTEKLLMLRAEDLARSNKDLEQFAYFMSHDLKEPLRNVATCLQMLKKDHQNKLGPDADQLMGYAEDSVAGMKVMIQDLLTYSRVTTRGNVPKRTDCERVLRQTLLNLRATIQETGAIITHDPLPTVTVDATQLVLLLQNLIGNALKFQGHNSPLVHVSAVKLGNEWQFSVRDNGIGIPAKYLQRIFMIFQRLHNKSKYPGSGMGLALVKRIAERHGGRVWADSKPNKGTTFYFTIPAD